MRTISSCTLGINRLATSMALNYKHALLTSLATATGLTAALSSGLADRRNGRVVIGSPGRLVIRLKEKAGCDSSGSKWHA
jgi:hypothetical protein